MSDLDPVAAASDPPDPAEVDARLAEVRRRIEDACRRARRRVETVTLVVVTKYATPEQVRRVIRLGVRDFGENYVQNLTQRAAQLDEYRSRVAGLDADTPLRWHLVGHLQRNKVKQLLPHLAMLQTLDSLRLAEEVDVHAQKLGIRPACLMQVNVTGETQKSGVVPGAAVHLAEQICTMPGLRLMGLMCMTREGADDDEKRHTFSRCRELLEEIRFHGIGGDDFRHLSMGMSDDYESGILEGATVVRVGSAIFGTRPPEEP